MSRVAISVLVASAMSASRLWARSASACARSASDARLLGDRPGQLGLLPRRLLGGERRLALALHPDPLGDVGLHADEADELALAVEDRADRELVPERGAVLAVVEQRRGDGAPLREGGADLATAAGSVAGPCRKRQLRPTTSSAS